MPPDRESPLHLSLFSYQAFLHSVNRGPEASEPGLQPPGFPEPPSDFRTSRQSPAQENHLG